MRHIVVRHPDNASPLGIHVTARRSTVTVQVTQEGNTFPIRLFPEDARELACALYAASDAVASPSNAG
jgi:hypothetical protein